MTHDEEKLVYIAHLQNTLGRLRSEIVVVATAIKGDGIRLSGIEADRIFIAAELLEKTQSDLSAMTTEIQRRKDER